MPYPNEHSARLRKPGDFAAAPKWKGGGKGKSRRTAGGKLFGRIELAKTISIVWGKLKGKAALADPPVAEGLRFAASAWTAAKAKAWLAKEKINYLKFEAAKPAKAKAAADLHSGPSQMDLQAEALEWVEAAAGDAAEGAPKLPRFTMRAYTGGAMRIKGWFSPVVVNLQGLKIPPGAMPVLKNHDQNQVVGHADNVDVAESLVTLAGVVSGAGEAAREVVDAAKNKFPWRASVGVQLDEMLYVPAGESVKVNGKQFKGPVYVAGKATLGEVSFVAIGADTRTSAKIAASADTSISQKQETDMNFQQWLEARGFDEKELTEEQLKFFKAAFEAESAEAQGQPPSGRGNVVPPLAAAGAPADPPKDPDELRAEAVTAERQRVADIEAACKGFDGDEVASLQARALAGELELMDLQAKLLVVVREGRPTGMAGGGGEPGGEGDRNMLLAAAWRAGMVPEDRILQACGEPALEAADKLRGLGLQEFFARCAMLEGVELPRYASDASGWIRAAFSTMTLPGILSAAANVMLLEGYGYVEDTWRQVVNIASVSNFLQHTRYRMTGDMKFQKVSADGELKHATLAEQEFTQQADTHGIMFALTRQDIINDDLGAFTAIPRMFGMGAGEAIAEAVWTLLLSNPGSFFKTGNKNYATGAGTALGIDSLTAAEKLFLDQIKPNGRPLGVPPKRLLVPTALKVTGEQLMASLKLTEGGGSSKSKVPTDNPHAGKFDVACSAYLSNAAITGYSATAWYLFADPRVLAALEVAFLNGIDRPTVERAEADFNTLGVQFRGWVDFGVKEQDHRGAVKMAGA